MDPSPRKEILKIVCQYIVSFNPSRPVRVCIDGLTAAGKSTFAGELVEILGTSGREVISTTLDGFHNPRSRRYEKGRSSPEGYYYDAYNYVGVIDHLLSPLGPRGNRKYLTQIFDLNSDQSTELASRTASDSSILIVDGSFALRKELQTHWDVGIYLSVDPKTAEDRAANRDAKIFGSSEEARLVTRNRYHQAHRIHFESARPMDVANFVICNDDPTNPWILIQRGKMGEVINAFI